MQKKLLTLAVAGALAAPVAALAQVTVYGTIDGSVRNQSKIQTAAGDDSQLQVSGGLRTTNRWGLKGSEDLGGGLMANFTLEGTYGMDVNGDNLDGFDRKAVVGVSKGGMSVDIGRDYTANFKAQGIYDPMSYTYTGVVPNVSNTQGVRYNNMITAGFRFGTGGIRVDYTLGNETAGPDDTGEGFGVNGDFAFGPVTVAAAFSSVDANAVGNSSDVTNLGAAYTMGAFTFRGGWSTTEIDAGNETPMFMLGAQYAFSPTLNGRLAYYNIETKNAAGTVTQERAHFIAAVDYYLSKRTTAYVAIDRLTLDLPGTVAVNGQNVIDGAMGIGAGIVHAF